MKFLKWIIIAFNIVIIYLAWKWYSPENQYEPAIVIIGQIVTLLTLGFEQVKTLGNTINREVDNSDIDVDTRGHADVTNEHIKDSNIKIKKR